MANVKLSAAEIDLAKNSHFILTKNKIINHVYELFGSLSNMYIHGLEANNNIPKEVLAVSPKISRGENLEGLPWVMLDCPRFFNHEDVFAIRTLFWWGNFFSITLHLKGKYFNAKIIQAFAKDWSICINENEWRNDFETDNYKTLSDCTSTTIEKLNFIKIAKRISLNDWENIALLLMKELNEINEVIKTNF
jgi:hypothetical protein